MGGKLPDHAARHYTGCRGAVGIAVLRRDHSGRFVNGLLSEKINSELLIRGGLIVIALGAAVLLLPLPPAFCMAGLILIGLGCAPIYPSMIYLVPKRFGKAASQSVIAFRWPSPMWAAPSCRR